MTGKVTNYESNFDEAVAPKMLHGVKEVRMLIIQCSDNDGRTQVLLGVEVQPGDIRVFPAKSWESLGRPSDWLKEQLDEELYGKRPVQQDQPKKTMKATTPVKMDNAI